jgi:hypothetical protein
MHGVPLLAAGPGGRSGERGARRRTCMYPPGEWVNPDLVADLASADTTAMNIFELPRCDGTNDPVVNELHDRAMDELVAEFTTWRRSTACGCREPCHGP